MAGLESEHTLTRIAEAAEITRALTQLEPEKVSATFQETASVLKHDTLAPLAAQVFEFGAFERQTVYETQNGEEVASEQNLISLSNPYINQNTRGRSETESSQRYALTPDGTIVAFGRKRTFSLDGDNQREASPFEYILLTQIALQAMNEAIEWEVLPEKRDLWGKKLQEEVEDGKFEERFEAMVENENPVLRRLMELITAAGEKEKLLQEMIGWEADPPEVSEREGYYREPYVFFLYTSPERRSLRLQMGYEEKPIDGEKYRLWMEVYDYKAGAHPYDLTVVRMVLSDTGQVYDVETSEGRAVVVHNDLDGVFSDESAIPQAQVLTNQVAEMLADDAWINGAKKQAHEPSEPAS